MTNRYTQTSCIQRTSGSITTHPLSKLWLEISDTTNSPIIKMASSKNRGCQGLTRTSEMKKDHEGFYEVTLGRYGIDNLQGQKIWHLESDVITAIQARAANGTLRGEFGTPKAQPGWGNDAFLKRMQVIDETNVACQFKDVTVDEKDDVQIVRAKVKPTGPHAAGLQLIIDQGMDTLVFGHRAFMKAGTGGNHLEKIVTWDIVKIKEQPTTE